MTRKPEARGSGIEPSGFFALRTPLLPFDELISWSEGLEAPAALQAEARPGRTEPEAGASGQPGALQPAALESGASGRERRERNATQNGIEPLQPRAAEEPDRLEQALAADRKRLRDRLRTAVARPEVQDALFVASPDFTEDLDLWAQHPDSERGLSLERGLVRYFARMAGRATPFGLFAGCSTGTLGDRTRLVLEARAGYQRHTRLDMDYLFALTDALRREPGLQQSLVYHASPSLYRSAGRLRYVESRLDGKLRSHHLVAAEPSAELEATLARARHGASGAALAAALAGGEVSLSEAEAYIAELVQGQLLVPDLRLLATGPEPIRPLVEQLRQHADAKQAADRLDQVRAELADIDAAGLGAAPQRYRSVARLLQGLPQEAEIGRLFQVDMIKPAPTATLGRAVLAELERGVEVLHRLTPRSGQDALRRFEKSFQARYEGREVPLLEALDEELGIGFPAGGSAGAEAAPLLRGLAFPADFDETAPWSAREAFLLRRLGEALDAGLQEIVLEPAEVEELASGEPPPLPDAFAVTGAVAAASEADLDRGDFRVLFTGAIGPSGARLLGRFCHADETLRRHVEQHLRAEEALAPQAVFAEVVHLPQGRMGNVLSRPVLRGYEIPFLGCSGAPPERQIPVNDILVSVRDGRIVLRSARLEREVIPRLTMAHNYLSERNLGVYRFLGALQNQGCVWGLSWSWGALARSTFLPRVRLGRLVLSRACWRLGRDELKGLGKQRGAAQFRAVQALRAARRLPRLLTLGEGDNHLLVDLDNVLSVESFVHRVKGWNEALLFELFQGPGQLCTRGPEGRFVHEIVVPYVRRREPAGPAARSASADAPRQDQPAFAAPPRRSFPPGSEWLYAKLYTGAVTADRVLRELVAPVTREAMRSGAADGWFFLRYGDPDWHLRLRLHGAPQRLQAEVLPALQAAAARLLEEGWLWRVQLDTYEREVERYGGTEGVGLAEKLFHADSEAVLEILEMLEGDEGEDERWRLTLRGMDRLLADLGLDLAAKRAVLRQLRESFARELRVEGSLRRQMGEKFQEQRKGLEALLDPARDAESPLLPGFEVLHARSGRLAALAAELRACERAGRLSQPIERQAASFLHMHANRLLRSAHRSQEMVLYEFLGRLYEAQAGRARGAS